MKTPILLTLVAALTIGPSVLRAEAAEAASGGSQSPQSSQPSASGAYTLNHGEVGAYADYFRLEPANTTTNYVGVGGRVAFNVQPNLAIEGELNYDFARNYTSSYTTTTGTTTTTTFVTSNVRPITGLFGPKLQFGRSSPVRVFVTGKLGFADFSASTAKSVTGAQFANGVSGIGGSGTHLAFYPGGGIEGFLGPVGLRAEAGDEIYLNDGIYNNLRVTVGPTIRF